MGMQNYCRFPARNWQQKAAFTLHYASSRRFRTGAEAPNPRQSEFGATIQENCATSRTWERSERVSVVPR